MGPVLCYLPMLEGQAGLVREWLADIPAHYAVIPVLLPPVDWNDDLTPWPAGPVFKKRKPFGGRAAAYLARLETELIPALEAEMGMVPAERWFVGVSLAGLFGVWVAAQSRLFTRVAAVSGSFWYPGFVDWLGAQHLSVQSLYLSLGDKEALSRNPHLKHIATETAAVVRIAESQGIPTTFEWNEGSHFGPILPRLDKALAQCCRAAGLR